MTAPETPPELRRAAEVLRSAQGERAAARGGTLIRINVREPQVPAGGLSLPLRALEALSGISEELERE